MAFERETLPDIYDNVVSNACKQIIEQQLLSKGS
jgi:hypothetical protein